MFFENGIYRFCQEICIYVLGELEKSGLKGWKYREYFVSFNGFFSYVEFLEFVDCVVEWVEQKDYVVLVWIYKQVFVLGIKCGMYWECMKVVLVLV